MPVIEVEALRVRYPGAARHALAGISFDLAAGEVFGLLGPNGAGKSSTQQVLTGQLPGYLGQARVLGRPVRAWGAALFHRIGVSFELPAYFPRLTASENLEVFARIHGMAEPSRVSEVLELVGLTGVASHRPETFSKGMKLRLNLARALLHEPEVLFLDEPTAGLDPNHAEQVHEVIRAQATAGRTVLLTSHDMATVEAVCDRVAFLLAGRIRAVGTPRELRLAYGRPTVRVEHRVEGQLRRAEFPLSHPTDPGLLALLRDGVVETVYTREATLREVFRAVTGGRL